MRFKPVPPAPDSLDAVDAARRAVPLVPDSEDDCCARLRRRRDLPSRDAAQTWLAFLRALELVEVTDGGFRRRRSAPAPDRLRESFVDRAFGARELVAAMDSAADPLGVDEAFDALRERVPAWERNRSTAWEADWRDRTERLLEWSVLLGLAERRDGGYVRSGAE